MVERRKAGSYCVYCNCDDPLALTRDHIVPKSLGGNDDERNIQTLCWTCNQLKGSLTDPQFKDYMKALKILRDLKKVRINFPNQLPIVFNQHHHPNFVNRIPPEKEPLPTKKLQQKNYQRSIQNGHDVI